MPSFACCNSAFLTTRNSVLSTQSARNASATRLLSAGTPTSRSLQTNRLRGPVVVRANSPSAEPEKPKSDVSRDDQGRLVDEDGWVIGYSDGDVGAVDEETAKRAKEGSTRNTPNTIYSGADPTTAAMLASIQGTHYEFMELSTDCTIQDVRAKYRLLSKVYHPDTTKMDRIDANQMFQKLTDAYETLSVPESRQYYDWRLSLEATQSQNMGKKGYTISQSGRRQYSPSDDAFIPPMDRMAPNEKIPLSDQATFALAFDVVAFGIAGLVLLIAFLTPPSTPPPM